MAYLAERTLCYSLLCSVWKYAKCTAWYNVWKDTVILLMPVQNVPAGCLEILDHLDKKSLYINVDYYGQVIRVKNAFKHNDYCCQQYFTLVSYQLYVLGKGT